MRSHAKASSAGSTSSHGISRSLFGIACLCLLGLAAFLGSGAPSATAAPIFDHAFGSFSDPRSIAVDESTGSVYVVDPNNANVQKFDADGNPADFSALGSNVLDGASAGVEGSQIAVDQSGGASNGRIYVVNNAAARVVDIFSPSGEHLGQLNGRGVPLGLFLNPCGVAVGGDGAVFVVEAATNDQLTIYRYGPSASVVAESDWNAGLRTPGSKGAPCAVALDGSGHIYAATVPTGPVMRYNVSQFSAPLLEPNKVEGTEVAPFATALAIDRTNGDVYVDHGNAIAQYDESGLLLGTFAESDLSESHGVAINSSTGDVYATDSAFATAKLFGAPPPAPPTIDHQRTEQVHSTSAKLLADVGPEGHATTYHAEYGTAGPCSVPASACVATPEQSAGLGFSAVTASAQISGLSPDTVYHYRLIAENAHGIVAGPDLTFRTYPTISSFLPPDNRAYERVSPADTNGYPVAPLGVRSASTAGEEVLFQLTKGVAPGTAAGVVGDVLGATRGAGGWSSKSLVPNVPVESQFFGDVPSIRAFSEDLTENVVATPARLTADAPVIEPPLFGAHAKNLYLQGPDGAYHVLNPLHPGASFEVGTPDLSHIVFGSVRPQIDDPDIPDFQGQLYEWAEGSLRLASVGPDGMPMVGELSVGGSNGTLGLQHPISADGSRFFFHVKGGIDSKYGQIYVRENGSSTTHVNASQRIPPDPNGPLPALFLAADAAHGARAIFTSCEQLTADSTASSNLAVSGGGTCSIFGGTRQPGNVSDLYLYDAENDDLTDLTTGDPSGADVSGFIGASDDLGRIYFTARGVLAPGASPGQLNVYLWDHGTTSFVGAGLFATIHSEPLGSAVNLVQDDHNGSFAAASLLFPASRVSANGRYLLLTLRADLTGYDNSGPDCPLDESDPGSIGRQCAEVYRYDAETARLDCLSCPASGIRSSGDSQLFSHENLFADGANTPPPNNILADGTAYFETPNRLVAEDTNAAVDVYQFKDGELRLISNGAKAGGGRFAEATPDGSDVFFTTPAQLVSSDRDALVDLYDARVGGGFPQPTAPPDCEGDACAPPPVVPNDATPSSSTFSGPGNLNAKKKKPQCPRGKVRHKGQCTKKPKHSKNRADHNRRASR